VPRVANRDDAHAPPASQALPPAFEPTESETVAPSPSPKAVLALQARVGNHATARAIATGRLGPGRGAGLARTPAFIDGARPGRGRGGGLLQRDPIFTAITSEELGSTEALTPDQLAKLNLDAGAELRRLAGNAVNRAAEQFGRGCDAVKAEIEKAAKQRAELIALAADIAVGFAAPGLAVAATGAIKPVERGVINRLLVDTRKIDNLAAASSVALANLDALEKVRRLGFGVNPSFTTKVSGDALKTTYTAVGKGASQTIKTVGAAKLADTSLGVVAALSSMVAMGAQDLDRSLPGRSEEELYALILALDAGVANATTYAAQIRNYLQTVVPIGSSSLNPHGGGKTSLVKMNAYGGPRLAVVETGVSGTFAGTPFASFVSWVSPTLEDAALQRAGLQLANVPDFNPDKLDIIPGRVTLPAPAATESRILPPTS
jgi:hypothetical protein